MKLSMLETHGEDMLEINGVNINLCQVCASKARILGHAIT